MVLSAPDPSAPEPRDDGSVPPRGPEHYGRSADLMKTISNPDRIWILLALDEAERTVSDLVAQSSGLSDQFVSRHLGILRRNGLVEDRVSGTFHIYRLTESGTKIARTLRPFCLSQR